MMADTVVNFEIFQAFEWTFRDSFAFIIKYEEKNSKIIAKFYKTCKTSMK